MEDDVRAQLSLERHVVHGAGGTHLAVRAAGDPANPPVVLLHGWAASGAAWRGQLTDPALTSTYRLIAADLRGHGDSEVSDSGYDDPATWAGDVAALLAFAGAPAVLVGWSYGGLVITDYVRKRGCAGLAGIVLVGALTEIGGTHPGGAIGPAMRADLRAVLAEDWETAVPALTRLMTGMTAAPVPGALTQRWLGDALRVPPRVRRALFRRELGSADVLAAISVPVLVMHGTADAVVEPSAGRYAAGKIPGASTRWFSEIGHTPFVERIPEFNAALHDFAGRCHAAG